MSPPADRSSESASSEVARINRLSREELDRHQLRAVGELIDRILPTNRFWAAKYENLGFDPATIESHDDFRRLPFVTKPELVVDHTAHPPFGTNLTHSLSAYSRLHQTSGTTGQPLRWPDTPESWEWLMRCWEQIYGLVGVTPDDRIAFPFSFGPFLGFWAAFDGAARLGCLCLPGGGLGSEARIRQILDLEATIICCTPTYALRLAEVAVAANLPIATSAVRGLIVAGEPGGNIPATRERIETAWGARVFDHWGMTEIGALGVEAEDNPGGLELLDELCLAEVIDSETLTPTPDGELGELVITNLGRTGCPLIRYRTGDLVRRVSNGSPSGRQLTRLAGGILGRADDMVIIRGNNVFPSSIEAILRRFPEVAEYRIRVESRRSMQHLAVDIEPTTEMGSGIDELLDRIGTAIKTELNFHADLTTVPVNSLPRFELKGRRFHRE